MSHLKKPRLVDGIVDVASIDELDRDDLRFWISNRLHGNDAVVPGDFRQGSRPYALFASLFNKLSVLTQQRIHQVVLAMARDMARNAETTWMGEAGHELLLLTQLLQLRVAEEYLVEMAGSRKFLDSDDPTDPNLHYRVLQSLVALGWRGTEEFWIEQANIDPSRYAGVAFNGLALIDIEPPLRFLEQVQWTEPLIEKIAAAMPEFIERYGAAAVRNQVQKHIAHLCSPNREALLQILGENDIQIIASTATMSPLSSLDAAAGFL